MLCYVMLCYVMLCYVMLCYVMLCYVMLCYVMPMQYTEIFKVVKNENFQWNIFAIFFLFFSQNRLWVHVRTASPSTHNLCFHV